MCEIASNLTVKEYWFGRDQEKGDWDDQPRELVVMIPEVLDPQYGMYVWPCAVVLSQYIWFHRRLVCGKRILEIGAGVSLPGIVAAKCGAQVTLSDNAEFSQCLDNCKRSCQMNNLSGICVIGLTWGHISPSLLTLTPVDLILGSDVFFEPEVPQQAEDGSELFQILVIQHLYHDTKLVFKAIEIWRKIEFYHLCAGVKMVPILMSKLPDFEDVISTVHYLMERNPHAQFWTTYQVRSANWSIEGLLYKWEMESTCVPLQSFEANKEQLAGSSLPGMHTIQMMVISKK